MIRKLLLSAGVGVVLLVAFTALTGCSSLPDNAAASVNGVIITKDAVTNRIRVIAGMSPGFVPSDTKSKAYNDIQRDVTTELVAEQLLLQETAKRNISVSDDEVNKALAQVVEDQYYGNEQKMEDDFKKRNITVDDLRENLKLTLLRQKLMDSLKAEVPVSDADVQAAYNQGKANYVHPERRQVRQIVTTSQQAAQQALAQISSGEDFATVAGQVSVDAGTRSKGGLVGLVEQSALPPAVGQQAFALKTGETSGAFQSGTNWYIVKVDLIQPAQNQTFDQVKAQLKQDLANQKLAQHYKDFSNQVHQSADIEYAEDYSPRTDASKTSATPTGVQTAPVSGLKP